MKKAIGYVRVSTKEQAKDDKFGIEAQKEAIRTYAEQNNFEIVDWFIDVISGAKEEKPAWDSIMYSKQIKNPPYTAVLVYKYDRIAREIFLLCYCLLELKRKGVELHSVYDDKSLDTPENKLMISLMGYCAEKERENITLRTTSGRNVKASTGGYSGGRPPYGYKSVGGRLIINEEEAEVVRTMFTMKEQGMTYDGVANYLNENGMLPRGRKAWDRSAIFKTIRLKMFYQGYYHYGKNKEWVKGQHEAILVEVEE